MPDTITLLGSLAGLDMQAVVGQPVWVRVHYAPGGKLLGGTEPPGVILGEPGYAPTGYGSARPLVTDEQGLFGGVLPWEDGGIYRVDVPGDVTRYLMMGTGAGEHPAGSTVNVRLLPGPDEVVTPSVALDALVGEAVEEYLTAHPPTGGGGGVTDHGDLTGLDGDDHPQYLTAARGDLRYPLLTDARLTDARTPTTHQHDSGDITSGTVAYARLPVGTAAGTVAAGNDARLTDSRSPSGAAGGGLAGTYPNPTVAALRGVAVSATAPTAGQVLTASSGTTAAWTTPAAGAGDATTTAKGVVQLAGDLAGTAAAPTVAKVNGTTPAATGLALLGAATSAAAKTTLSLVKADVGLSNVDNTSDTAKPVSTAQQAAINARIAASIVDAKGDLIAATANDTVARLAVGADGQVLTADSTQTTGLKWAAASSSTGGVASPAAVLTKPVVGKYYTGLDTFLATGRIVPRNLTAYPISFGHAVTLDQIGVAITSNVAGSLVRLGIYGSGSDGLPSTLLLDAGTVDAVTAGDKTVTIGQELAASTTYWLVITASANSVAAFGLGTPNYGSGVNLGSGSLSGGPAIGGYAAGNWDAAALPSTFPSIATWFGGGYAVPAVRIGAVA